MSLSSLKGCHFTFLALLRLVNFQTSQLRILTPIMRVNTQNSNVSANRRIRLPISPSRRDDRRICDRRLHTVFNKACDLWLRLQKQAPSRLAVMVEMDGSLQVFLSTYDALDNDWPPTREDVIVCNRTQ